MVPVNPVVKVFKNPLNNGRVQGEDSIWIVLHFIFLNKGEKPITVVVF